MLNERPCLVCHRPEDDPLHGGERGGLAHDTDPRLAQHVYDPGERRKVIRRQQDRQDKAFREGHERHLIDEWNREHPK